MDSADNLDDKDSGPEVQINFPSSVSSRIEELLGGTEEFDSPDFDAVSYINRVFPTEQSLSGVETLAARCEYRLESLDHHLRALVRAQPEQREAARAALTEAQGCIHELALQVTDINKKAERSESMVREITSEIKQLDCAKTNLTAAITTLNHFHMLVGGVHALRNMTQSRQYKEIVLPLQAIMEVLQHFECYREIREINALRDEVHATRNMLASQILADFKESLSGGRAGAGAGAGAGARTLAEACGVVEVLEPRVRRDLLHWFIALQLQEYSHLFSASEESAWLSHVERRYAWLKKHLLALEEGLGRVFPPSWRLSERLAHHFCKITREQLAAQMSSRRGELDVKLLLYAIQKTYSLELLLHKRFVCTELPEGAELRATDTQADFDELMKQYESSQATRGPTEPATSPWVGQIGACFEPYLSLYINSLDANLSELMERFIQDAKASSTSAAAVETTLSGAVMSSCADLFLFYKKCLVQCARLSTGEPMIELAGVFQKYLRSYARHVLAGALPRGAGGPAAGGHAMGGAGGLVTNLHTLLRDDTATRYTKAEISKITSVITTAEYCLETSVHLEQKLKEKVSARLLARVDLSSEQDLFHAIIANCIQLLVQDLELGCEPPLSAMTRIAWQHVEAVGDQSAYVTGIVSQLRGAVPALRDCLAGCRKYFTQFCIRFASSFIPKFIQNIYRCKPISTVGSEQLLLDTHMLKTALLELPSIGSEVKRPAPATYTKVVIKQMTKAEMILKLVMSPLEAEGGAARFVAQFVAALPECSQQEFHKLLDMKGALPRHQRHALDQLFRAQQQQQQQ